MRKTLMAITGEDAAYKVCLCDHLILSDASQCNNISAMELNKVRPFVTKTLDRLQKVTVEGEW